MQNKFCITNIGKCAFVLIAAVLTCNVAYAGEQEYNDCLLRELKQAEGKMTVHDLRDACTPERLGTVEPISEELLRDEKKAQ